MKECLHCKREYEPKRDTSKFCSVNCRVKYHKNHGKPKDSITPIQMQVLYNSIMDAVGRINERNGLPEPIAAVFQPVTPQVAQSANPLPKVAIEAIKRKYVEDRRECNCDEDYILWIERLENDVRLTSKDKQEIKNTR